MSGVQVARVDCAKGVARISQGRGGHYLLRRHNTARTKYKPNFGWRNKKQPCEVNKTMFLSIFNLKKTK